MNLKKTSITASMLLIFIVFQSFYTSTNITPEYILSQIEDQYRRDLNSFSQSLDSYLALAKNLDESKSSKEDLIRVHIDTRLAFKNIEYLLEYYDASGVKQLINGAPLPKIEQKVADLNVIQPKGLQILDELIFEEDLIDQKDQITSLLQQLISAYQGMKNYQFKIKIQHRHVLEAVRQEIIRVLALGITGFDTPGSVNGLQESHIALMSISKSIMLYSQLVEEKNHNLSMQINELMKASIEYIEGNTDFDTFDRMTYIRDYLNPLYGLVYDLHRSLGIETSKETENTPQAVSYDVRSLFDPEFLNTQYYTSIDNGPLQNERETLGKLLFFDPILSESLTMSCATCHRPELAFTDGLKTSKSNSGGHVQRNAPTLLNAVFAEKYFLDLRESFFDRQMNHVVANHQEFNTGFIEIMDRLKQSSSYMDAIQKAYPDYGLSQHAIGNSIATYVSSLVTIESPFDQYMNLSTSDYSDSAKNGFNLFMGKAACGTCHFAPIFNGLVPPLYKESESEILGVPATKDTLHPTLDYDLGRMANAIPLDESEIYSHSFKTTTVRNAELTAPYMHNGVYNTLEEVMDFYNKGGGIGLGYEVPYQTIPFDQLGLTESEQQDIISFIKTLTDAPVHVQAPKHLPTFEDHPEWNHRSKAY